MQAPEFLKECVIDIKNCANNGFKFCIILAYSANLRKIHLNNFEKNF